jgi:hypothetical protein
MNGVYLVYAVLKKRRNQGSAALFIILLPY